MARPRRQSGSPAGRSSVDSVHSDDSVETHRHLGSLVNSKAYIAYEVARRRRQRRWTYGYLLTILLLLCATGCLLSLWLSQKNELEALRSLLTTIDKERAHLQADLTETESEKKQCEEKRETECGRNFTQIFGNEITPQTPAPQQPQPPLQLPPQPPLQLPPQQSMQPPQPPQPPHQPYQFPPLQFDPSKINEVSERVPVDAFPASSSQTTIPLDPERDAAPSTPAAPKVNWLFQYRYSWTLQDTYSWKMLLFFWSTMFVLFRFVLL